MNKELLGTLYTGEKIYMFALRAGDTSAAVISRGAAVISFKPYGREIISGIGAPMAYLEKASYRGASVGRVCNRIVGARFEMDGRIYELTKNNGDSCLHGGSDAFHDKAWEIIEYGEDFVRLGYTSPDGQSGFPGETRVEALYSLSETALTVTYRAIPNKKTPLMITNHAFFNLDGEGLSVEGHRIKIYADEYTEIDGDRMPTGRNLTVSGSAFDFKEPREIGERIEEIPLGYDHNFILRGDTRRSFGGEELTLAAEVWGKEIKLSAYTNQPGVQFYAFGPMRGEGQRRIPNAFCLESQIAPNCVNHGLGFCEAGEVYLSTTVYEAEKIG